MESSGRAVSKTVPGFEFRATFEGDIEGFRLVKVLVATTVSIKFSGGCDEVAGDYSDKILMFNKKTGKFEQIGKLEQGRCYHSMSVVDFNDYNCM